MISSVIPLILGCALAHPGHGADIERSAQVEVSPTTIEVTYYVGLSGTTMRHELETFDPQAGPVAPPADTVVEQEHRRRYAEGLADRLPAGVRVTVDGTAVPLTVEKSQVIPRRGSIVEVTLTADWPDTAAATKPGSHTLTVTDGLLAEHPGGWRIAVRGRGGVEIAGDDVAPILVRAVRHDMGHLSDEARTAAATLTATIVRP